MKIAKQRSNVEITDNIQAKEFGITFDRHMVNILSNQLYEDKVLALVRELSTNALDSQIEAGFTGKFDVNLPSYDDPTFWIRDYGTGMSPEKVDNIYRNYGASDRNESNDFTGCMGLGSKTPFCYHTKTFTVDVWHNSIHYQYACFLNDEGMPQIAKMVEELSNERSGVKVTLPVKKSDIYDFEEAATKIYRFFQQAPKISGRKINIEKPSYTLEDGNWKYDENEEYGMRIVMGNVSYPVNEGALGDLTSSQRKVINAGFHVYVPIGEVGVTASREGLDYTNRTKTHIRSYINKIIQSFNQKAQDDISGCKNLWEARIRFIEYERDTLRGIFDSTKITYNNTPLFKDDGIIDLSSMIKDGKIEVNSWTYQRWDKNPKRTSIRGINVVTTPTRFYRNDLKVGGFVRSVAECHEHKSRIFLVTFHTPDAEKEFCDTVGIDSSYFTNISTIPSPTIRRTGVSRGKTTKVMEFLSRRYDTIKSNHWKSNVDIEFDEGGVYVEFNRFNCVLKHHGSIPPRELSRVCQCLENAGITLPTIYGVKSAHIRPFEKSGKWQDFWAWAVSQLEQKIADKDVFLKEKYQEQLDKIGSRGYYNRNCLSLKQIQTIAAYCESDTLLSKFSSKISEVQKLADGWESLTHLRRACDAFRISIPEMSVTNFMLDVIQEQVYNKYKLLKSFGVVANSEPEHIAIYINAVEQGEK